MKSSRKQHKKSSKRGGNKVAYNQPMRPVYLAPPKYIVQENRTWVIRITNGATSTVGTTATIAQLAGMLGVIATSATASQFICDQFRIRRICMWSPVATAGVPVTNEIKWVDDPGSAITAGPPKTCSDSSVSFDRPAYVCLEPPKGNKGATSIFAQWLDSSSTTAWIQWVAPAGTIVDIHFNFILDDIGNTSAGPTLIGATAGNIYHKSFTTGAATWTTALAQQNPI